MGMSSSQARLLSLTSRMHDIEYRAQRTEAQKLQLANESDRVYETYLDALEKKKLVANLVNTDGSMYETELTANHIYSYKQLYEQYALKTAGGKSLIPENLHNTYKNTSSLSTYLDALGLTTNYTQTIHHVEGNPAYTTGYEAWEAAQKQYELDYADFLRRHKEWEDRTHPDWEAEKPQEDDPIYWDTSSNSGLANDFKTAGSSCYTSAVGGSYTGCYKHILERIIDFSAGKGYDADNSNGNSSHYEPTWYSNHNYTTSTGTNFKINFDNGAGCRDNYNTFTKVSEKIDDEATYKPSEDADGCAIAVTASSSEFDRLISKYNIDGSLKSIKQWAIDLWYACDKYSVSETTSTGLTLPQTVEIFQSNLVSNLVEFNQVRYDNAVTTWEGNEPPEPTWNRIPPRLDDYIHGVPETLEHDETIGHSTFTDKDLTQWYANLWCRMEGLYETPEIEVTKVFDDSLGAYKEIYSIKDIAKSNVTYNTNTEWNTTESDNYIVIPSDKMSDPKWISNAVGEGFVLIQQWDPIEKKWRDTSPASTTRISEIPDTVDVKKAEAQYEADMRRIDRKDAKYDAELSAFDTERNAIKNEMETLKTVAKDNVDRTFKLFS